MGKYDTDAKIRKAMQSDVPVSDGVRQRIDETLQGVGDTKGSRAKQKEAFWNTRKVIVVCILILFVTNASTIYTYAKDLVVKYQLYDMEHRNLNVKGSRGIVKFTEPLDMEATKGEYTELSEKFWAERNVTIIPYYLKHYRDFETLVQETGVKFLDIKSLMGIEQIPATMSYSKNINRGPCEILVDATRLEGNAKAIIMNFYTKVDDKEEPLDKNMVYGNFTEKYVSSNKKLTSYLFTTEKEKIYGCWGYMDNERNMTQVSNQAVYLWEEGYGAYLLYDNIEYQILGVKTLDEIKRCIELLAESL